MLNIIFDPLAFFFAIWTMIGSSKVLGTCDFFAPNVVGGKLWIVALYFVKGQVG